MLKRIQLILLFMLVFSTAFLLGNIPEGRADSPISVSQVEFEGEIRATLDGDAPIEAYYKDADGNFQPMIQATRGWITNGLPDLVDGVPSNGREINYTTLGAAIGSWITIGKRKIWIAP